ncbi:MAG: hypothetical protein JKY81_01645 [Colwellia sp.]|nr:hypothetical protein [Colwellia sp.]
MSLRDYFAGQALAGFCANRDLLDPEDVSQWSYGHADAMLAARGGKDD